MITNLQIRNFRGLKDVTLRELRRINLLVGGNDTGKTSVLEALTLLLGDSGAVSKLPFMFRSNPAGGQTEATQDDKENFWPWLFFDRNFENQLEVSARTEDGQALVLKSERVVQPNGPGSPAETALTRAVNDRGDHAIIKFRQSDVQVLGQTPLHRLVVSRLSVRPSPPAEDAEKYNQIALESGGEAHFEQIMREVEPRLKRLRYAKLPGTHLPLVFVDLGLSRAVPATQMGQAFNRILHIYAEILTAKTNILLIDEVENGIFSESLELIWKGLFAVCERHDVQIFATTHSRECVMAAHAAAQERGKDELSVQRLQFVSGQVEAVRLGGQHLDVAAEMGLEVRS